MKQLLCAILACLLLCGCRAAPAAQPQAPDSTVAPPTPTDPTANPLEIQRQGTLRVYPLSTRKTQGMRAMDVGILLFSGYGSTTLTLLTGEELSVTAGVTLDFELSAEDPSLQIHDSAVSFFHPEKREMLILNSRLKEVKRIPLPEALTGTPILSPDRSTLFYCTARAVMAWNLDSGIHRTVKEMAYDAQTLAGLHCGGRVLECHIVDNGTESTCYLAVDTGTLVHQREGSISLTTEENRYYAAIPAGGFTAQLFGDSGETPQMLIPADLNARVHFLPRLHAAVAVSSLPDEALRLEYYDLEAGMQRSSLTLEKHQTPKSIVSCGDCVYLLVYAPDSDCDIVYRWNPGSPELAVNDGRIYTAAYQTEQAPDRVGLARCQKYAREISDRYGIQILVWDDAATVCPEGYALEAEYLSPVLYRELQLLDQRLSRYPDGMLAETAAGFSGLRIGIVRSITGTVAGGTADTCYSGVQFLSGSEACILIAAGGESEAALYRGIFLTMQTRILNKSIAFDQWDNLNPAGFAYCYGEPPTEYDIYLQPDSRAFVNRAAMTSPGEDRATVMVCAMLPGNGELFRSHILQSKLVQVCRGIREAYGLTKSPEVFPWEQYLTQPLSR